MPDFLELVAKFTRSWFQEEPTWGPWFRGEAEVSWRLRPKLYRDPQPKRDVRILDNEFRQEFVIRAPSLSPERPQNSWEWYFLMQHSGCSNTPFGLDGERPHRPLLRCQK
jgi:hypothetical protein